MTYQPPGLSDDLSSLPKLPSWVTSARAETLEEGAFLSGAALAHLQIVVENEAVPQALLRERLALRAAETCVAQAGRVEKAGDLRDAVQFLQPGDRPGPAGETYLSWRRAIERPISVKALHRALPHLKPEQIAGWLDVGQGAPVARATSVMEAVLKGRPKDFSTALLLADAALAQALGPTHVTPLLGVGVKRGDLRHEGDELRLACHRAVSTAAIWATREAADLTRRAALVRAVAPKLRARGADAAVDLFLTRDAAPPTALTSLRSDRAARRFCDRLVELGAVRELTGRDTFRLYGV